MRLASARHVLFGMAAALAISMGAAVGPALGVAAQAQPTIVLSPSSGPCDAPVHITGRDFPSSTAIRLDVAGGGGEATLGKLASLVTDSGGSFALDVTLGTLGCEGAQWIEGLGAGPNEFWIFADFEERPIVPGQQGIPNILTRATYTYSTTGLAGGAAAQPQPTMVLSPSSGPCDARVEVTGQDFPPNATIELGVGEIGGRGMAGHLDSVVSDADGRLSFTTLLGFLGCGMAGVTKERTEGDHLWVMGYVLEPGPYGPAARLLARAPYTFTTTESTLPIAILTLSPLTGPCDAMVEARGELFEPGSDVMLQVARPHSEGFMGTLAQVRADVQGGFVTTFAFGALGCEAAALDARANGPSEPNELHVCGAAYQASRCGAYTYTTTAVSPEPQALPSTGSGPEERSTSPLWFSLAGALAGMGLLLVAASVYRRRQRG